MFHSISIANAAEVASLKVRPVLHHRHSAELHTEAAALIVHAPVIANPVSVWQLHTGSGTIPGETDVVIWVGLSRHCQWCCVGAAL